MSAFTTAGHVRFLLLHDGRSDDLVRSFFRDVHELYLRVRGGPRVGERHCRAGLAAGWRREGRHGSASSLPTPDSVPLLGAPQVALNPFHTPTSKITSPPFHQKVRQLARNYFR